MNVADVIFVSMEDWDEVWRRNQFVCAELARRHAGMKVLFVGLPRNLTNDLRRGQLRSVLKPGRWTVPGVENVVVAHPWKVFPDTLSAGRGANERLMRRQVRSAAGRLGIRRPILWLNPHHAVHMAGRMGECGVVYDVTDDWSTLSQKPWMMDQTRRQDAELCRRADAVIVCSQRLLEMKRRLASQVHLIPNGVDAEHYRAVLEDRGPLPDATRDWKRPVLGYTGTLHTDRIDVDLLEAVARKVPEASIVLIGPNHLAADDLSRLRSCGNIFLTGQVPYRQLPQYMRAFDVCITPHRMSEFTESLNPIKLWEYLAAGKPIVSTDVAGFRDYRHLVRIARGADEFVAAIHQALGEGNALWQTRRDEAARHSWRARVDQIEVILESVARRAGSQNDGEAPAPDAVIPAGRQAAPASDAARRSLLT
jgi:glycosyltransferase involved in cell wall biosynthesis